MLMREDVRAGIKQFADHFRASLKQAPAWPGFLCVCAYALLVELKLSGFCQPDHPAAPTAGIDFEKSGADMAALEAVLDAFNSKFALAGAHENVAAPLATAVGILGIDVVKARVEVALDQ